jgi:CheY-like chemotaxis protein
MPSPSAPRDALRIFIVEDHADSLGSLKRYLEAIGHAVWHASTIADARARIAAAACDVLLSDLSLPDGTGWELLAQLRADGAAPPFAVAMSGLGSGGDCRKSQDAGFQRHLLKPFSPEDLDRLLAEVVAARNHGERPRPCGAA